MGRYMTFQALLDDQARQRLIRSEANAAAMRRVAAACLPQPRAALDHCPDSNEGPTVTNGDPSTIYNPGGGLNGCNSHGTD